MKHGIVSCTACHFSPAGGGPRNSAGKLYGNHNYAGNPLLAQSYLSADVRLLYYRPSKAKESKDGIGLMSGSVAGHVALDEQQKIWLVLEHNIAGFSQAPYRDTYVLFNVLSGGRNRWLESVLLGRFRPAFGFVSDEHRTYTRMQTSTEWYTFETGAMFSGTPAVNFHYDLALVNGASSAGQSLSAGQADQWGGVANLRWQPRSYLVGVSGRYSDPKLDKLSRNAWSLYTGGVVGDWTLMVEYVRARGLNAALNRGFASDATYASSLAQSESTGWLSWLEWAVNERVALIYKFDSLTPDRNFTADVYERHGLGVRWAAGPNLVVQGRAEWAKATHPSEKNGIGIGAQNAAFALLQIAL